MFALGCVISFSCCAFGVPFWSWVLGAVLLFFSVGLFGCVFVCVFSSFYAFFGPFLVLSAGRRAALFSLGLFVCVLVFFLFMKAILSFLDFFFFHFCFDLTQVSNC